MPDFELKVFQADAAKTIVDRYAFFAGHPYRPSKGPKPRPFFQALSALTGAGKTPVLAQAVTLLRSHFSSEPIIFWMSKAKSVVAPTAGLHFSKHLLKRLEIKGAKFAEVTLHVGLGTFNPVEVEDLSKHKMDSEELKITQEACDIVNEAKANKKRICAVGTTSMRAIESSVSSQNTLNPYDGWTNKFIFPPHDFSIATCMITNFHTPKSTLLMMISAFCGHDLMRKVYDEAIKEGYKFYSYGDAMLIL